MSQLSKCKALIRGLLKTQEYIHGTWHIAGGTGVATTMLVFHTPATPLYTSAHTIQTRSIALRIIHKHLCIFGTIKYFNTLVTNRGYFLALHWTPRLAFTEYLELIDWCKACLPPTHAQQNEEATNETMPQR